MIRMLEHMRADNAACRSQPHTLSTTPAKAANESSIAYERALGAIVDALVAGRSPAPALYAERDYHMLQLSDAHLQQEYLRHTETYLDPATPNAIRGMAEMLVIKLGELTKKPYAARVEMADAQQRGRALAAAATARPVSAPDGVSKHAGSLPTQEALNDAAYQSLRAQLTSVLKAPESNPALFQRLANRHELQIVLMTHAEARRLTHSQMQAWGTSGLQPQELRAVLHAITHAPINGKAAVQFKEQLRVKVRDLVSTERGAPDALTRL